MSLVNTNAKMLTTPNPRVSSGEVDMLSALGQQLEISPELLEQNPELAKLLGENPENLDFQTLLGESTKGMENNVDLDLKALQNALAKGEITPDQLTGEQKALLETAQANPKLSPYEIQRNAEEQALNNTRSIFVKPGQVNTEAPIQNAEQASKAFVPERKSMFDVQNKAEVAVKNPEETKATKGLMNLDEFIANQSQSQKAAITKNPYKSSMSESMFAKKIEADAPKLTGSTGSDQVKLKDLMLMEDSSSSPDAGASFSQKQNQAPALITATGATAKTFDMAQLNTTNQTDVINQIQNYIIQSKASSEPTVQMSFEHKDLGMVDLTVSKLQGNQVSVMINSHTQEGSKFFNQHQNELLQSLTQSGIKVSEFKLDTSSNTNQNNNQNHNHSSGNGSEKGQFAGNEKHQRNEDSRRREELWSLFNNKEAA